MFSFYGRTGAGGRWEKRCVSISLSKGWVAAPDWRSCYWRRERKTLLIVRAGDLETPWPAELKARLRARTIGDPEKPEPGGICIGERGPQARFLGCHRQLAGVMSEDGGVVRRLEYGAGRFFRSCRGRWAPSTGEAWGSLPAAPTPFLGEESQRRARGIGPLEFALPAMGAKKVKTTKGFKAKHLACQGSVSAEGETGAAPAGMSQPRAAPILSRMLYGARLARPVLLRSIFSMARRIVKWRPTQDHQIYRLVCRLPGALSFWHFAWVGDAAADFQRRLHTDADLASDPEDSVSTSGAYVAIVGPRSRAPIAHRSEKQTAVAHSSAEAELAAADRGLRAMGLPALDARGTILGITESSKAIAFQDNDACCRFCRCGGSPTRGVQIALTAYR